MNQLYGEINKLKQGNFQDYETFYNLTCQYIYKIIKDIVVDDNASAQVLTATYNQIYQTINTLADNSIFYMWAGRIATDESLKYVNATGMTSIHFEPAGEFYPYNTMNDDQEAFVPENILNDMEIQRIVQNTIDGMEVGYKIVMQYFYYEGMSVGEIAARLNIPEEQVKYAVGYIKSTFRNIINSVPYDNNTKMYSLAQIPVFWIIFKNVLDYATMGVVGGVAAGGAAAMAGGNIAGAGAAVGGSASSGAALGGTVSGSGMVAGNGIVSGGGMSATGGITAGGATAGGAAEAGGAVIGGTAGGAAEAGGTVIGGTAGGAEAGGAVIGGTAGGAVTGGATAGGAAATATAAQTGILATIGGKIALGVAATAILAVGGIAIHNVVTEDDDNGDNDITIEQVSDASDTDATPIDVVEDTEEVTEEATTEEVVENAESELYNIIVETLYYEDESVPNYWSECDVLTIESDECPELAVAVETWATEIYEDYVSGIDGNIEAAQQSAEYGDTMDIYTQETIRVVTANSKVLVLSHGWSSYTGGAHGYNASYPYNFDVEDGKILTLQDLGDIRDDMIDYLTNYFYGLDENADEIFYLDSIPDMIDNNTLNWYFTNEGIFCMFNQYEIAPYAAGVFSVTVPYEELPGLDPKYNLSNISTSIERFYNEKEEDLDGDGNAEILTIGSEGDYETGYTPIININDNAYVLEDILYCVDDKFIYTSDEGKKYLLISTKDSYETVYDYSTTNTYLYSLGVDGVNLLTYLPGYYFEYLNEDTLHMKTTVNILGNYTASKNFKIIDDQLVATDGRYTLKNTEKNTGRKGPVTKVSVNVMLMENNNLVQSELPAGTIIYPANTDNATVLGFYLEDGTYGEIYFETTDSGVLFDGKTEAELFDNIVYGE